MKALVVLFPHQKYQFKPEQLNGLGDQALTEGIQQTLAFLDHQADSKGYHKIAIVKPGQEANLPITSEFAQIDFNRIIASEPSGSDFHYQEVVSQIPSHQIYLAGFPIAGLEFWRFSRFLQGCGKDQYICPLATDLTYHLELRKLHGQQNPDFPLTLKPGNLHFVMTEQKILVPQKLEPNSEIQVV